MKYQYHRGGNLRSYTCYRKAGSRGRRNGQFLNTMAGQPSVRVADDARRGMMLQPQKVFTDVVSPGADG